MGERFIKVAISTRIALLCPLEEFVYKNENKSQEQTGIHEGDKSQTIQEEELQTGEKMKTDLKKQQAETMDEKALMQLDKELQSFNLVGGVYVRVIIRQDNRVVVERLHFGERGSRIVCVKWVVPSR